MSEMPSARRTELICEDVAGECVVYDQRHNKVHHLNESLTWIWRKCDGQTSIEEIAATLEQEFGAKDAGQVVLSALQKLEDCELLDTGINMPQIRSDVGQVSRRAVVAGGSLVVPAVVSMLAPTPADAKSGNDKDKDKDKTTKRS